MILTAVVTCSIGLLTLGLSLAAFRRTNRRELEEERDRLLVIVNEEISWALVSEARFSSARITIEKFPERFRQELSAAFDDLQQQIESVAKDWEVLAELIRSDRAISQTRLRIYRRQIEALKPSRLFIAEQHNQILASFPLGTDNAIVHRDAAKQATLG